jgi:hypothetical protein
MTSPRKDAGFLTQEQREKLRVAVQNAETLSLASPRSPTAGTTSALLQQYEQQLEQKRAARGGGGGGRPRHVRRLHSGKTIKVKKGEALVARVSPAPSVSAMIGSFAIAARVVLELALLDCLGYEVQPMRWCRCFDHSVMLFVELH